MKKERLLSLLLITLLVPFMGLSCGGDNGNGPGDGGEPPALPELSNPSTVDIAAVDSDAEEARDFAEQYLQAGIFAFNPSIASPNDVSDWGTKSGGCWNGTTAGSGCTTTFDVCDAIDGYEWTVLLDGTCGGDSPYSDWIAAEGTTIGTDGRTGSFTFYADSSTDIANTLNWSIAGDDKSGNAQLYDGEESAANLAATLTWTINSNQSKNYTGEIYNFSSLAAEVERVKWELHLSADPDSGWLKVYVWGGSPSSYRMRNHISWDADSAGNWIEYDEDSQIIHTRSWQSGSTLPRLRGPELLDSVDFCSDSMWAQSAESMVEGMLGLAQTYAGLGLAYFTALDSAHWTNVVSGCRSWSYEYGGCMWEYRVCEQGDGYQWTYAIDGTCYSETYNDWTVFQGTTSDDGRTGTLVFFETNSTAILSTWKWTQAGDDKSGTWEFYDGAEAPANLQVQLTWAENTDGSVDLVWEYFDSSRSKWELHAEADGKSGTMRFDEWDDDLSIYWVEQEIIWNTDCTGSWTTYDQEGTVLNVYAWE